MVKNLILLVIIFLLGCEINSEQLIKNENINFENIKFNTVSKNLKFNNNLENKEFDYTKALINDWFNNNIKIDGFEGSLNVVINTIEINKRKEDQYYRFEISLNIDFIETNQILNKRKTYNVNSVEYADIHGNFSIKDTENLEKNTILKCLKSINQKFLISN